MQELLITQVVAAEVPAVQVVVLLTHNKETVVKVVLQIIQVHL